MESQRHTIPDNRVPPRLKLFQFPLENSPRLWDEVDGYSVLLSQPVKSDVGEKARRSGRARFASVDERERELGNAIDRGRGSGVWKSGEVAVVLIAV